MKKSSVITIFDMLRQIKNTAQSRQAGFMRCSFKNLFSLLQRSHSVNVTVASTTVLSPLIRIWFRLLSFREPAA